MRLEIMFFEKILSSARNVWPYGPPIFAHYFKDGRILVPEPGYQIRNLTAKWYPNQSMDSSIRPSLHYF
jgi:hypothetical protein